VKQPARHLFATYLAIVIAGTGSDFATAAEVGAVEQDLASIKASNLVLSAAWKRQPDSYALLIVLDRSSYSGRAQPSASPASTLTAGDRGSFFIGNTIANLRGLDPWIACGRTLTMVEGRRTVQPSQGTLAPSRPPVKAPNLPNAREGRVEVWLLKADGTHIQPATYTCVDSSRYPPTGNDVSISYGYSNADSAQAVAAAIRIDGDFYIEKLQPLAAAPAVQ
jgi:hypothetical protein